MLMERRKIGKTMVKKTKYAIYKNACGGLYALRYFDNLDDCKSIVGGWFLKKKDLPIVVNAMGGRFTFRSNDENFVEIISCNKGAEPLTREQMYPKNLKEFLYGWIDTDGNTYTCEFEDHWACSNSICKELGLPDTNCEQTLENKGWIKVTASWEQGRKVKRVFCHDRFVTKEQAAKLYDLGLHEERNVPNIIQSSREKWKEER